MRIGFVSDWFGASSTKVIIIEETISGKYVCKQAPIDAMSYWGNNYEAESPVGIFLRDKSEAKIKEG